MHIFSCIQCVVLICDACGPTYQPLALPLPGQVHITALLDVNLWVTFILMLTLCRGKGLWAQNSTTDNSKIIYGQIVKRIHQGLGLVQASVTERWL